MMDKLEESAKKESDSLKEKLKELEAKMMEQQQQQQQQPPGNSNNLESELAAMKSELAVLKSEGKTRTVSISVNSGKISDNEMMISMLKSSQQRSQQDLADVKEEIMALQESVQSLNETSISQDSMISMAKVDIGKLKQASMDLADLAGENQMRLKALEMKQNDLGQKVTSNMDLGNSNLAMIQNLKNQPKPSSSPPAASVMPPIMLGNPQVTLLRKEVEALSDMLDMVKADYASTADVDGIRDDIAQLKQDLIKEEADRKSEDETIEMALEGMGKMVTELSDELNRVDKLLNSHGEKIGSNELMLQMLKESYINATTFKDRKDEVDAELDGLKSTLDTLAGVGGVADMVSMIKQSLPDIRGDVDMLLQFKENILDEQLPKLNSEVSGNSETIDRLLKDVIMLVEFKEGADRSLDDLEANVEQVKKDYLTKAEHEILNEKVDKLKETVTDIENMLSMVKEDYIGKDKLTESLKPLNDMLTMLDEFKQSTNRAIPDLEAKVDAVKAMLDMVKADYVGKEELDKISEEQDLLKQFKTDATQLLSDLIPDVEAAQVMLNMLKESAVDQDELEERIKPISESIRMLEEFKNNAGKSISDLEDGIGSLQNMLDMVKDSYVDEEGLEEHLKPLTDAIDMLNQLKKSIPDLEAKAESLQTMLDMVKANCIKEDDLAESLKPIEEALKELEQLPDLESQLEALKEAQDAMKEVDEELKDKSEAMQTSLQGSWDGLGDLCRKVSEMTDIKDPVHSSTTRRWFLEKFKRIETPVCYGGNVTPIDGARR